MTDNMIFDQEKPERFQDSNIVSNMQQEPNMDEYDTHRRGVTIPNHLYIIWAAITSALLIYVVFTIVQFQVHHDDMRRGYETGLCAWQETIEKPLRDPANVLADCEQANGTDVSENARWW